MDLGDLDTGAPIEHTDMAKDIKEHHSTHRNSKVKLDVSQDGSHASTANHQRGRKKHRFMGRNGLSRHASKSSIASSENESKVDIQIESLKSEAASWAQLCPLMAALLGPLSVLLGIPALSQGKWLLLMDSLARRAP